MTEAPRDALKARIEAFIRASAAESYADSSYAADDRDKLLTDILAWQVEKLAPLARLKASRSVRYPSSSESPDAYPALPTDLFRSMRIASFDTAHDTRVFRTSGTTQGTRGAHVFQDLDLYDLAAETAARFALFPDVSRMRLIVLAPSADELSDSSLSYMLSRFHDWFGTQDDIVAIRNGELDMQRLGDALADATRTCEPVALLGTSFAFVHADDAWQSKQFSLPSGSRIMQTGGFKGRSREVEPDAMRAMLEARYGVPDAFIVAEYGMTELSSQMYETTLRDVLYAKSVSPRRLWVPPWVRALPVHPETCLPVAPGTPGILRIDDAANLDSCVAIQTADLATAALDGIVVQGRDPSAVPRGCSLAMDIALSDGAAHA